MWRRPTLSESDPAPPGARRPEPAEVATALTEEFAAIPTPAMIEAIVRFMVKLNERSALDATAL